MLLFCRASPLMVIIKEKEKGKVISYFSFEDRRFDAGLVKKSCSLQLIFYDAMVFHYWSCVHVLGYCSIFHFPFLPFCSPSKSLEEEYHFFY